MAMQELEEVYRASMKQMKEMENAGHLPLGRLMGLLTPSHGTERAQTLAERVRNFYPTITTAYRLPIALGITMEEGTPKRAPSVHLHVIPYGSLTYLTEEGRKRMEENLSNVFSEEFQNTGASPFDISFHDPVSPGQEPVDLLRDISTQRKHVFVGAVDRFRDELVQSV